MSAIIEQQASDNRRGAAAAEKSLRRNKGTAGPHVDEADAAIQKTAAKKLRVDGPEENCPVIRANQILFTGGESGRLRVVFF